MEGRTIHIGTERIKEVNIQNLKVLTNETWLQPRPVPWRISSCGNFRVETKRLSKQRESGELKRNEAADRGRIEEHRIRGASVSMLHFRLDFPLRSVKTFLVWISISLSQLSKRRRVPANRRAT